MAISYPLTLPNHNFQGFDLRLQRKVATVVSPFTYASQSYENSGTRWEATVTLPPLTHTQAREWQAFFVSLRGTIGTFKMYNPLNATPHGNLTADCVTAGSGSPGDDNISIKRTESGGTTLKAGDFIALYQSSNNPHIYMLVEDLVLSINNTGYQATFEPTLRTSVAQGIDVQYAPANGIWRLATNEVGFSINQASLYGFSFACVEADL